jgi:hypothetical protein
MENPLAVGVYRPMKMPRLQFRNIRRMNFPQGRGLGIHSKPVFSCLAFAIRSLSGRSPPRLALNCRDPRFPEARRLLHGGD